jgi:hypothetical protein
VNSASFFQSGEHIIGTINGSISIPKFGAGIDGPITDLINSILPITIAQGELLLKGGLLRGNIDLRYYGLQFTGHVTVNLNLPYTDPGFIDFGKGTIALSTVHHQAKASIASLSMDSITVPVNTVAAVIRIRSGKIPAVSTVIDPNGKTHSGTPDDSLISYHLDQVTSHGFWLIVNPIPGKWILSMPSRTSNDTVDAAGQPIDEPLKFSAVQSGKHVTLNWTPLSSGETADVTAYLDDSNGVFKGFLIARSDDKNGTLSFDLNDSLPGCSYYLYAVRDNSAYYSQAYSTLQLDNSKASTFAPTGLTQRHLGGDSILLRWTPTSSDGLFGYTIRVSDANGADSNYGSVFIFQDSTIIVVKNSESKRISLLAYGDGVQSCWSQSISASSSVPTNNNAPVLPSLGLEVWPNPSTGKGEITFTLSERNMIRITIFDLLGNEIISPVQGVFDEGEHTSAFDLSMLPTGTYYCRAQFMGRVETVKVVIERWRNSPIGASLFYSNSTSTHDRYYRL